MIFIPHSQKQEDAIFAKERIVLCSTGIQWGKTSVGAARTKLAIHEHSGEGCNHIVTAPNYKIMSQASLPEFMKIMKGCGTYKKADAVFEVGSGAKVYFRTATDPDSIVGITDVYSIWGDEAGKYPYYFWLNILGRSRFRQCPITLTTSLYSYNWVAKELIRDFERGLRDDIHLCQAESRENKFFPEEEYEAAKKKMSSARFAMMYGGRPAKMEGTVYDCFDEDMNIVQPFDIPNSYQIWAGIDWGYTQPFACTIVAKSPNGHFYVLAELVQTRLTDDEIIVALKQKMAIWNIQRFYAGPDQPASIKALNKAGLPCTAADNGVRKGIDVVYTLIQSRKLKIFEGKAPNLCDEIEAYHWPEEKDLKPDEDDKDRNPVKQNDHSCDSLRYCMISIANKVTTKRIMKTPTAKKSDRNESIDKRLKRLKKVKGNKKHESW